MGANIYANCPGVREANEALREAQFVQAKEVRAITHQREVACSDLPLRLCGVEVEQFKLRHWQKLSLVGNPFVVGGAAEPDHVLQFLWAVSVRWSAEPEEASAFAMALDMGEDEHSEFVAEIQQYVAEAFEDAHSGRSGTFPSACTTAYILHELGTAYPRMTRAEMFDMNLGEIFQRLRLILEDTFRAAGQQPPPSISRVDKVRGDIVFGRTK